jgi:hypothetical protein
LSKLNNDFERSKVKYTADLNLSSGNVTVPLASRPLSGTAKPKKKKQGVLKKDQQNLLLDNAKDREQEILDGIEKF